MDLDFAFLEREAVLTAVGAAGLSEIDWYLRGPTAPEATTRLYVLATLRT